MRRGLAPFVHKGALRWRRFPGASSSLSHALMGISLRPDHLKRYSQLARLLVRYGRSDLVRDAGLEEILAEEELRTADDHDGKAEALCAELEALGPTFVKVGQLLSTRVDLLPLSYTEALERLQDNVEPFPFLEVERILEEELGVRVSKAFQQLEEKPIAAASLGQVHRARLRDGRMVAVKVQRPDIREKVVEDLAVMAELAETLERFTETGRRYALEQAAAELRRSLLQELDYRLEAANLTALADNLQRYDRIIVPRPVHDYSTSRVLTMDYVQGRKITAISPLARLEMDGEELAGTLFDAYLKQVLVDGLFHADPHPGNVFLTQDGRIALLDVGMVGRVGPELQDDLTRLLLAIGEQRGEDVAQLLMGISERRPSSDRHRFESEMTQMVMQHGGSSAGKLQIGRVMIAGARLAAECGFIVPSSLTLLGKTLLNLDQVGRTLDPDFEPDAAIRRSAAELLRQRMLKAASPGNLLSSVLEMNEFTQRLPGRLNRVLDAVADREVEVRIRVTNEAVLMGGLQKVANRVASGVVLAALIVGAAMLMRVETSFRIFGYPGFAMLLFLAAVLGGLMLLVDIILHDRPSSGANE